MSMMQPYKPPRVSIEAETLPELHHILNFMNNHSEKVYTEGYFLKLTDLLHDGKAGHDRNWVECFASLRGTVLSLWDAVALDTVGADKVAPTYLNLTDASIKMIDKLPTRSPGVPPLTNVLSISTAGRNRYLLHFNSHHSLAQWTASIRLSMFEQSKLQEIYTGALIAAKGRELNAIKQITERTRFKYEEWVRVRFGAGTPWRKCWCVITQPDEKAAKKAKAAAKKANKTAYEQHPIFKGDIKFYNDKKTKKQQPIATITDAFAAYAIYPQSKQLIDVSTLVKVEGRVKIHGDEVTESEGFVFIMPDMHPAISGFETMLRFLFPTFDTFALYGRPGMLIPDKTDPRSMMFAMPKEGSNDCGYLDVVDVVNLIVTEGSNIKLESEWRAKISAITHAKIKTLLEGNNRPRTSLPAGAKLGSVVFHNGSFNSTSSLPVAQADLPPQHVPLRTPPLTGHMRSVSDTGYLNHPGNGQRQPSFDRGVDNQHLFPNPPLTGSSTASSEEDGLFQGPIDPAARRLQQQTTQPDPEPVPMTPVTTHPPSSRPPQPLPQSAAPRRSLNTEENLFEGVVPSRNGSSPNLPPPPVRPQYSGPQQSQITQQSAMGYENTIEPPPGFALQNSRVLLRGPPPSNDEKTAYDDQDYANHPPPGRPMSQNYTSAPTEPYPHRQSVYLANERSNSRQSDYYEQAGTPPIPAKIPLRVDTGAKPAQLNTKIERKPVASAVSQNTPDSLGELATHLIDERALDKIGPKRSPSQKSDVYFPPDEDTLDRRAMERIQRVLAGENSDSEYDEEPEEEEDEPDYASIDTDEPPPVKRNAEQPRAGRMKVVGQEIEPEVVVGDAHYRPSSSGKPLDEPVNLPKVDFGSTINHGRSLSTEMKVPETLPSTHYISSDNRRISSHGSLLDPANQRAPSRASAVNDNQRRESFGRPSPDSQSSDSDQSRRRSVAWQPGMAQIGGKSPDLKSSAEQYVSEKAAAAQNQSRSRYVHSRKPSGQLLNHTAPSTRTPSTEHLPTRPSSRGGNAAFLPNGLVSTPDLSAHLSAREQEYVARKTGSTLLQMDASKGKPPPHKAGLIGAIHSREQEKQQMKDAWQRGKLAPGGLTVQQEIARRQQQQVQRDQAAKGKTPSPRLMNQQPDQQSYFPQQSLLAQQQQQQQMQMQMQQQQQQQAQLQQQQMMYGQQPMGNYGYGNQVQGNQQMYQGNPGYQGNYYSRT
ncbi:hypothetical protein EDC01DRAFT_628728 [Geopyxis carbonaria]|nr:hypothetical protein EDC01DRAFT_628728 [Geopyxis carbonaria]